MYDVKHIVSDKERLSAIVDNSGSELFLLDQHAKLEETWKNYYLIGDVIRGEKITIVDTSLADSVMASLENEVTYSQEMLTKNEDNLVPLFRGDKIKPDSLREENRGKKVHTSLSAPVMPKTPWFRQLSQIGVAASVAIAVVFGVRYFNVDQTQNLASSQQPRILNTIPLSGNVEPVSFTRDNLQNRSSVSKEAIDHKEIQKVNALLQDYELQLRLNHVDHGLISQ